MGEKLLKEIENLNLFKENETIVLALSGGVDSMVLFDILKLLNYNIVIAHVNHKARNESDDELKAIKTLTLKHHFPFRSHEITTDISTNFQAKAREIRYNFFKEVADEFNTKTIVTAHHLDDQVETFMMRLVHNHDLFSLRPMAYRLSQDHYEYVRPFARTYKQSIIEYAKDNDILFFEDRTNFEDAYLRNHFRNNVIPPMKESNPNFDEAIFDKMLAIEDYYQDVIKHVNTLKDSYPYRFPIRDYLQLPKTTQKQLLICYLNDYTDNAYLSNGVFNSINNALKKKKNFVISLPNYLEFHVEYNKFFIQKKTKVQQTNLKVDAFGQYEIEGQCKFIITKEKIYHKTSKCIELWYNDVVFPIHIRNRAQGDYMEFSYGRKKLKKLLIDEKVSPSRREDLLLIAKENKILWIPELGIQSVSKKTDSKLYIYFEDYSDKFAD